MSYSDLVQLTSGNVVYDLVRFSKGGNVYGFTSGNVARTWNNELYVPDYAIQVGEVKDDKETGSASLEFIVPIEHVIAQMFRTFVPSGDIKVQVMLAHEGDLASDAQKVITIWTGFVVSSNNTFDKAAEGQKKFATLSCASRQTIIYRNGLSYRYGSNCQHTVYRGGCNLSMEEHEFIIAVEAIDGTLVASSDLSAQPDTRFPAGLAKFGDFQWRDVTAKTGPLIQFNAPFEGLQVGDTMKLYTGCNRSEARCIELDNFENLLRFDIPTKNLFITGVKS